MSIIVSIPDAKTSRFATDRAKARAEAVTTLTSEQISNAFGSDISRMIRDAVSRGNSTVIAGPRLGNAIALVTRDVMEGMRELLNSRGYSTDLVDRDDGTYLLVSW